VIARPSLNILGQLVDLSAPPLILLLDGVRSHDEEIDGAFNVAIRSRCRSEDGGMNGPYWPLSYSFLETSEESGPQRGQCEYSFSSNVITIKRVEQSRPLARFLDMDQAMLHEAPKDEAGRILGRSCEASYLPATEGARRSGQHQEDPAVHFRRNGRVGS